MARGNLVVSKKDNMFKAVVRRLRNECSIGPAEIQKSRLSLSRVQDRDSIHSFIEERKWKTVLKMLRTGKFDCRVETVDTDEDEDEDEDEDKSGATAYNEERPKLSRRHSCLVSDGFLSSTHILLKACQRGAPVEVINMILISDPDMVKEVTNTGKTPLHVACDCNASLKVIECLCDDLLMESPASLIVKDYQGHTALDYSLKREAPREIVSTLSDACLLERTLMAHDDIREMLHQEEKGSKLLKLKLERVKISVVNC
jgi:hypothetical protein